MTAEPGFRLDGFEPADAASEHAESSVRSGDLTVLAEHHTSPGGSLSYIVAHDTSATWGLPGTPELVAIKITRDLENGTYAFEAASHAGLPFAQNWLVERGCPYEPITQVGPDFMTPADDRTIRLERKIRTSGDRYEVLDARLSTGCPPEIPGSGPRAGPSPSRGSRNSKRPRSSAT